MTNPAALALSCAALFCWGSRQAETERQPAAGTGQQWLALAGSGPNETSSEADEEKNEAKDEAEIKYVIWNWRVE